MTSASGSVPSRARARAKDARGFTLIEVLVVIAIIGILASIALVSFNTARRRTRDAQRIAHLRGLQLALELYYTSHSPPQYPQAKEDCETEAYGLKALTDNGYIPQIPRDPSLPPPLNCYLYTSTLSTPRRTYHLGATLEESSNPVLKADKNCDSTDNDPVCSADATFGPPGTRFDGTGAKVYDLVP